MADAKISGLPSSTGVTPASDSIPIVHNGTTEKITPSQLITGVGLAQAINTGSNGFMVNCKTVTQTYDVPVGYNALAVGPITIAPGVAFNMPAGSRSIIL